MPKMTTNKCLALIGILGMVACSRGGPGIFSDGKVPVTVEKVLVEETKPTLSLPATLVPANKVVLKFPIDVQIKRVAVRLGEVVDQNDVLFELDELDLSLKSAGLKAKREEKKSLLNKNTYFLENRDRLLTEGKIDQTQYDALEAEVAKVKAEVEVLNADVAQLENQINHSVMRAPFPGVVSEIHLAANSRYPAGDTLLSLVQIDPIYVSFQLPAAEAGGLETGTFVEVQIEGFGGQTFSASILSVSPELDAVTHNAPVTATLPNASYTFKGGMQAQVTLKSQRQTKILSIPAQALRKEGDKEYVFVIRENKAWPVRVFTSKSSHRPEWVEIQAGLSEEDLVVTEGPEKLKAGAEVNLWR